MEDVDKSSSVHDMKVTGINDLQKSPHLFNKKAYDLEIDKDVNNVYSGRLGFNMYRLPEGEYTICIEFWPVTMNNVSVDVVSTSLSITQQSTKKFSYYTRSIVHVHKWHISPQEWIYLDLKCQGTPETDNYGYANLIIYGVKNSVADVPSSVYDSPFIFENQKMVMKTDLDTNGHKITNLPGPTPTNQEDLVKLSFLKSLEQKLFFTGSFDRTKDSANVYFGNSPYVLIAFDYKLVKMICKIALKINANDYRMQIRMSGLKDRYLTWTSRNNLIEKEFDADIFLTRYDLIWFFIEKMGKPVEYDYAYLSLVFSKPFV